MGFVIEDGRGTGRTVGVDENGLLGVRAVTQSIEHSVNHEQGLAFNIVFNQTPGTTDACILYLENTSERDIVIEGVLLSLAGATEIYTKLNDKGSRNAPTDIVPVNLNAGSGNVATGTFEQGSDLAGGSATLSGGKECCRGVFRGAISSTFFNFSQDIIIPKGATFSVYSTAAVEIDATMPFNYHDRIGR